MIQFTVYGVAAPKGNKSAFPVRRKAGGLGVAVKEGKSERFADWRRRVEEVVQTKAREGVPMHDGPLAVRLQFYLPRPQSEPKTRRTWPVRKPDLDKLCRGVLDCLSGVLIADDARVIELWLRKDFAAASADPRPRVEVLVDRWGGGEKGEEPGPQAFGIRVEESRAGSLRAD